MLREKKSKASTQKMALKQEIDELKHKTDQAIYEIQHHLIEDGHMNLKSQGGARSQKSVSTTPYYTNCPSVMKLDVTTLGPMTAAQPSTKSKVLDPNLML